VRRYEMADLKKAEKAVLTVLRKMKEDGRVAYLMGEGSQCFEDLTAAYAEMDGLDLTTFRNEFSSSLRYAPVNPLRRF